MKRTRYIPRERKLIIDLDFGVGLPELATALRNRNIIDWVQMTKRRGGGKTLSFKLVPRDRLGPIELLAALTDEIARLYPRFRGIRDVWNVGDHAGHVNIELVIELIGDVFRTNTYVHNTSSSTHMLAG